MLSEGSERLLRSGQVGGQWDYHVIPYEIDWRTVKPAYKPWVQVMDMGCDTLFCYITCLSLVKTRLCSQLRIQVQARRLLYFL